MNRKFLAMIFAAGMMATSAFAVDVIIRTAPPRPIVETRVVSPGPGYVWIGGYHHWDGGRYVWTPGRWDRPPRPHQRWVAEHYVRRGGGYVMVEGRWR